MNDLKWDIDWTRSCADILGYTDDGKNALLEQLPMANMLAEDRVFAFQELQEIRAIPTTPIGKECGFASGDIFTINHKAAGRVRVLHVHSRYQFADIFTKGLPSALFEEFRISLSVRCPPAPTAG
ncbi:hypothetical protein Tco_1523530 [Tanacetum coccineum]